MRAFVVDRPGRYAVTDVADPVPGPGEVLVEPLAVGLCGSDLEVVEGRRPAAFVRYPVVPGHEWVGQVVDLGPGARHVAVGQVVVGEGIRPCRRCDRCREGRSNLCSGEYAETGFTHPGALAERMVVPAGGLYPLPATVPVEPAALIEPAACVASGLLEVGTPRPGARIAVVGDGPVGLLALLLVGLSSPAELVLVGQRPERMALGPGCGASDTAVSGTGEEAELRGRFDLVIEATNSASGAAQALALARRGGTVLLVGISGSDRPTVRPDSVSLGQLRVQGAFGAAPAAWRLVVDLYARGRFDPGRLITHRYGLADAEAALAALAEPAAGAVKVLITRSGR